MHGELQNKYCLYGSHAEVALLLSGRCMTLSNTNEIVFSPTTVIITGEKGEELRNERVPSIVAAGAILLSSGNLRS